METKTAPNPQFGKVGFGAVPRWSLYGDAVAFCAVLALSLALMGWCAAVFSEPWGVSLPGLPSDLGTQPQISKAETVGQDSFKSEAVLRPFQLVDVPAQPGLDPLGKGMARSSRPSEGASDSPNCPVSQPPDGVPHRAVSGDGRVHEPSGGMSGILAGLSPSPGQSGSDLLQASSQGPQRAQAPIPPSGLDTEVEWFGLKLRQVNPWLPGISRLSPVASGANSPDYVPSPGSDARPGGQEVGVGTRQLVTPGVSSPMPSRSDAILGGAAGTLRQDKFGLWQDNFGLSERQGELRDQESSPGRGSGRATRLRFPLSRPGN